MNSELLKRLAKSFLYKDEREFMAAMKQIISSERKQGHAKLADELTRLISNTNGLKHSVTSYTSTTYTGSTNNSTLAVTSKSQNIPLIDVREPKCLIDEIVLGDEISEKIKRFLFEYATKGELSKYGLKPQLKLLFFGPPGNGKTYCADILAKELNLPLFYVRFDSLIASYLGETAANLRKVFDFATSHTGVLLFDEFDAIGKSRNDHDEVGELKRVVNTFLQLLDNYEGLSPIIAATNHEKLLDYALWRRFDSIIYFPQATQEQIEQYIRMRLSAISAYKFNVREAARLCKGMSYAEVARAFTDAVKLMVLSGENKLTFDMFESEVSAVSKASKHRQ